MHSRPMCIEFAKEREWGNFAVSMGRPQATRLSASEGLRLPTPHQAGLCPWTPLGALPSDPHNRLKLRARHVYPNFHDFPQVLGG